MSVPVSIQKKQAFLYWMIDHLNVEAHDISWFLRDLIENEQALHQVHFVDDITDCPKGIIITSHLNDQIFFQFFKGRVRTENVYTAYHEINLYQNEPIFVQINFPFSNQHKLYQDVIEDDVLTQLELKAQADKILNYTLQQGRRNFLMKEINLALEHRNHERFMYYSSQLRELESSYFN